MLVNILHLIRYIKAGICTGALCSISSAALAEKAPIFDLSEPPVLSVALSYGQTDRLLNASPPAMQNARMLLSGIANKASDIVFGALQLIGVRYRWGGNTPRSGFDCSGFVRYVFRRALGTTLPRRAEEMSRVGERVGVSDLQPGDLVFFNTMRRTFSHVGIYIGNNRFVHAPSRGKNIRIDQFDNRYWKRRFTGARRIEARFAPPAANGGYNRNGLENGYTGGYTY